MQTADPFLPDESDPLHKQGTESSIWEVDGLADHCLASISGLAKVFHQQLTKTGYDPEDFLDHTYRSVGTYSHNCPDQTLNMPADRCLMARWYSQSQERTSTQSVPA